MTNKIKLNILQKFLIWSAGANQEILSREICLTERYKYESIGMTVVLTSIMALLSGGYALFTVFGSVPIAMALGSFWSIIIFNLDRFFLLTASRRKSESQWRFYLVSVPIRLGIAVSLSFVIAKPLELRLFEIEINQEIERVNNKNKVEIEKNRLEIVEGTPESKGIKEINVEIEKLDENIPKKQTEILDVRLKADNEYQGKGVTAKFGDGPAYKEFKMSEQVLQKELDEMKERKQKLYSKREELEKKQPEILTEFKSSSQKTGTEEKTKGVLAQISTLERLSEKDPAVKATNQLIVLLFIIIEISPILVKMLSSSGLYEELVMQEEKDRKAEGNIDRIHKKKILKIQEIKDFDFKVEEIKLEYTRFNRINREKIENIENIRIDELKSMLKKKDEIEDKFLEICENEQQQYKDLVEQTLSLDTDENIFGDSINIQKDIDIR